MDQSQGIALTQLLSAGQTGNSAGLTTTSQMPNGGNSGGGGGNYQGGSGNNNQGYNNPGILARPLTPGEIILALVALLALIGLVVIIHKHMA